MSPYLVLLILEFFPARLAMLPYGLDSNVTQLLANLLTKPSVFYYLPIVSCNILSIKLLLLLHLCIFIIFFQWNLIVTVISNPNHAFLNILWTTGGGVHLCNNEQNKNYNFIAFYYFQKKMSQLLELRCFGLI